MFKALLRLGPMLGFLVLATFAPARADDAADQAHALIQRQLDAFEHGDAPAAHVPAAPSIKVIFPTPGVFMEMGCANTRPSIIITARNSGRSRSMATMLRRTLTIVDDDNQV